MKVFLKGQYVEFMRMDAEGNPVIGHGHIVGDIIGVSQRQNYQVKEGGKAFNIEPHAINCTEDERTAYIAHYKRVGDFVQEFEKANAERVAKANAEIDAMHEEFFGSKIALEEPPKAEGDPA
jgi:hypothetical protein